MNHPLSKIIKYFLGAVILSIGIAFNNMSLFGSDPMSCASMGIVNHFNISFGLVNLLMSLVQVSFGYIMDKKNVSIWTLIGIGVISISIDIVMSFIPSFSDIFVRSVYLVAGVLLYCFGIAIQQRAKIGYNNFDVFAFGLKDLLKIKNYSTVRYLMDGFYLIMALLLKAVVGVGTFVLLAFAGILIQFFEARLKEFNF